MYFIRKFYGVYNDIDDNFRIWTYAYGFHSHIYFTILTHFIPHVIFVRHSYKQFLTCPSMFEFEIICVVLRITCIWHTCQFRKHCIWNVSSVPTTNFIWTSCEIIDPLNRIIDVLGKAYLHVIVTYIHTKFGFSITALEKRMTESLTGTNAP